MAGISNCRYCDQPIIWMTRGNGSWHRPFDAPAELVNLDYEVSWDAALGDWSASPIDTEITAKLTQHDCPKRAALLTARREAAEQLEADVAEHGPPLIGTVEYDTPPPRVFERVVYRNPKPESYEKAARRLRGRCPTCGVMPFQWCRLKGDAETYSQNLHSSRKDNG